MAALASLAVLQYAYAGGCFTNVTGPCQESGSGVTHCVYADGTTSDNPWSATAGIRITTCQDLDRSDYGHCLPPVDVNCTWQLTFIPCGTTKPQTVPENTTVTGSAGYGTCGGT
jgi:hypothetical protein